MKKKIITVSLMVLAVLTGFIGYKLSTNKKVNEVALNTNETHFYDEALEWADNLGIVSANEFENKPITRAETADLLYYYLSTREVFDTIVNRAYCTIDNEQFMISSYCEYNWQYEEAYNKLKNIKENYLDLQENYLNLGEEIPESVEKLYMTGIMTGVELPKTVTKLDEQGEFTYKEFVKGNFGLDVINRAQFINVLYTALDKIRDEYWYLGADTEYLNFARFENEYSFDNVTDLDDDENITEDMKKAIKWAYQNSITKGSSETTFGPYAKLTSGHIITFLYRFDNYLNYVENLWKESAEKHPAQHTTGFEPIELDS